jgi:hydroxyacylglutathione hydrolase
VGKLVIKRLEVGMLGTNCYLVMDDDSREGYVIDPGAEARAVTRVASEMGLKCKAVLCTHGHMDHVGAVGKVTEALGAPAMISETDSPILAGAGHGIVGKLSAMRVSKPGPGAVVVLEPEQVLEFGARHARVVPTPGHTHGSMSFIIDDGIFCGDLVFQGSIGRTDLRGGSLSELLDSVRRYVWTLPADARIFPGHGPDTTVRIEKRSNPYLRDLEPEA